MKFVYHHADVFDDVDPEYQLCHDDGHETGVSIQDCRIYHGAFQVNELGGHGDDVWSKAISDHRTLKAAKTAALAYYMNRTP